VSSATQPNGGGGSTHSAIQADRLDFTLPPFTRITWADRSTQIKWAPRFQAISATVDDVGIHSVAHGIRNCSVQLVAPFQFFQLQQRLASSNLEAAVLGDDWPAPFAAVRPRPRGVSRLIVVAAGLRADLETLQEAWRRVELNAALQCLGWPACCAETFLSLQNPRPWIEMTWHTALNSACESSDTRMLTLASAWSWHGLLRPLGIFAHEHQPCSSDCHESKTIAESRLALMRTTGMASEAEWLEQVLAWPIEWSSLHGIAEIKTPLCKISTSSDSLARKYTVRIPASTEPEGSPTGLVFPYRLPHHLSLSGSRSFQRGIANPTD
jgi:hypothetical protein